MKSIGGKAALILSLMILSYAAGTATASDPVTIQRLNMAIDGMTKARALLGASTPTTRVGIADLAAAKTALDNASAQTQAAVKAEGG